MTFVKDVAVRRFSAFCLVLVLSGCSSSVVEDTAEKFVTLEDLVQPDTAAPDPVIAMSEILAKNPEDEAALIQRGNAWFQSGDFDNAINDYTAALAVKNN